jgi:N-acyl-phosphatidylethanolamine-hydrolysing phospholipase D
MPCTPDELPVVDAVVISHNHYDHLDLAAIRYLFQCWKGEIHFFAPLGIASWFISLGIPSEQVTELDWWDTAVLHVPLLGKAQLTCTPSQHTSGRSIFDNGSTLWSSWVLQEITADETTVARKLYFAGDTGYRSVPSNGMTAAEEEKFPHCPAFKEIGLQLGPFDVALLPIGLCQPRHLMSPVHCNPWDSVQIHKDIKSKVSIGMHWGTVRGGLSQDYEDVRDPPCWWKQASEAAGLQWGLEAMLLDIGETFVVE